MLQARGTVRTGKAHSFAIGKGSAKSVPATQILKDYQTATEQYALIVRYLNAAAAVLTGPECQALLDFAEIAKDHCERLHGKLKQVGKHGRQGLANPRPSVHEAVATISGSQGS
jgi:hypothetical protein